MIAKSSRALAYAEMALSDRALVNEAIFLNRIHRRPLYDLEIIPVRVLQAAAKACAARMVWC
jgi:hypothetical protein